MTAHALPPPSPAFTLDDDQLLTYRRLAVSVIRRAFKDLAAPGATNGCRESARVFLDGSPMLFHWCSVAALDPRRIVAHARLRQVRGRVIDPKD